MGVASYFKIYTTVEITFSVECKLTSDGDVKRYVDHYDIKRGKDALYQVFRN